MRVRIISSIAVVLIALAPTLIGGPLFACSMAVLGIAGFREFLELSPRSNLGDRRFLAGIGYAGIAVFAFAGLAGGAQWPLFAASIFAALAPLVVLLRVSAEPSAFLRWTIVSAGTFYLGLPVFAATALRSTPGNIDAQWLAHLTDQLRLGWAPFPRGLAWTLVVVVSIWVGDSAAYLFGRAAGKRKLAPRISPNKTVEGALGGLLASSAMAGLAFSLFGLGNAWFGLGAGAMIGAAGQLGDLTESFLKRQAGVKDSGSLIPGHGGVLDRIDALVFAFPAGLLLASAFDRLGG